jgi:hypothetical protein
MISAHGLFRYCGCRGRRRLAINSGVCPTISAYPNPIMPTDKFAGRPKTPSTGGQPTAYGRSVCNRKEILERAKGLEPSTPTLARSCSTTELHPHPKALAMHARSPTADLCQKPPANATGGGRSGTRKNSLKNHGQAAEPLMDGLQGVLEADSRPVPASARRRDSSHFPNEPRRIAASSSRWAGSQSKFAHHSTKA